MLDNGLSMGVMGMMGKEVSKGKPSRDNGLSKDNGLRKDNGLSTAGKASASKDKDNGKGKAGRIRQRTRLLRGEVSENAIPVPLGHMPGGSMGAGMQLALTTHQTGGMNIAVPTMPRIHKQRHLQMVLEMEEQHPVDMLHLLQILLPQAMVKLMQPAQLLQMVQMGMVAQLMFLQLVVEMVGWQYLSLRERLGRTRGKKIPRIQRGRKIPRTGENPEQAGCSFFLEKKCCAGGGGNWGWLALPKGSNQTRRSSVPNAFLLNDFVCVFQARTNCIWALFKGSNMFKMTESHVISCDLT